MKKFLIVLILLSISSLSFGQGEVISDGPYIFIEKDKLINKSILNNEVITTTLNLDSYHTLYYPEKSTFKKIKKIAALSDIHGQYDLAIELLKNNKIIDEELNWSFDKGHLVITGDIFDRGDKVNEL
ncbi:MAG: metallophosphoesterase, partial [Flavobacteriales bacterium]|nr:metallophosphoesterase [Flavobacteriales bacterium]